MNDPVAVLKKDHREAEAMLKTLATSKPGARRRSTLDKLTTALTLHMQIEESDVYPLVAELVGKEDAQEADIEHDAGLPTKELMADLAASAMAFRAISKQLPDDAWQFPVRVLDSAAFPAAQLLTRRLVEVELHHCDLGTGYGPDDWPKAFAIMELPEPMRSLRQDRVERAQRS